MITNKDNYFNTKKEFVVLTGVYEFVKDTYYNI